MQASTQSEGVVTVAGCQCDSVCTCVLQSGANTTVYGSGSASDPYVIETTPTATDAIRVVDTASVDMSMSGGGTQADPYVISAAVAAGSMAGGQTETIQVTVSGSNPALITAVLRNVQNWTGGAAGHVLTKQANGNWAPSPGITAGPGLLVVGEGLVGDGSAGNPLQVRIPTYADARALQS